MYFDWKCKLCNKWVADGAHLQGKDHLEAVKQLKKRADQAARASSAAADAASRRRSKLAREQLLEVRALSPSGRRLLCGEPGGGGGGAPLPLEAFDEWPLLPRVGDVLVRGRGAQPFRLAEAKDPMEDGDMARFVSGFATCINSAGVSLACGDLSRRYACYLTSLLGQLRADSDGEVLVSLLSILLQAAQELPAASSSAARKVVLEAVRSPFVRQTLPAAFAGAGASAGRLGAQAARALDFVESVVARCPEELCHLQPLLQAATQAAARSGGAVGSTGAAPGPPDVEHLFRVLQTVGDALARSAGRWDAVSWRRMPAVPAPLSGDLEDSKGLPTTKAAYSTAEDYLDVMYRLLRANCFLSLQRGVRGFLAGHSEKVEMRVYRARVSGCGLQTHGTGGFVVTVSCEALALEGARRPRRKALLFGSLLCLSLGPSAFVELAWGRVLERRSAGPRGIEAVLELPAELNTCHSFRLLLRLLAVAGQPLLAAEAPVFYPAHGPVLRVLQAFDAQRLPLRGAVLGGPPAAEASGGRALGAKAAKRRLGRLLAARGDLRPDAAQMDALSALVERPLAVVQGPPGTGKTFVGLMATEVLVQMKRRGAAESSASDGTSSEGGGSSDGEAEGDAGGGGPVLVLCFKNHALDEFLTKAQRFTKNLVRLGGAASEDMAKYNLHVLASQQPKDRSLGRKLHEAIEARNENRDALVAALGQLFERTELSGLVLRHAGDAQLQSLVRGCPHGHREHDTLLTAFLHGGRREVAAAALKPCVKQWLHEASAMRREEAGVLNTLITPPAGVEEESSDEDPEDRAGHQADRGSRWVPLLTPSWGGFDATACTSIGAVEAALEDDVWKLPPAARAALVQQWLAAELREVEAEIRQLLEEDEVLGGRIAELERRKCAALLRSADIVGCTIAGAAIRVELLREVGFSAVVVEEAAEILEPMLLAAVPPNAQRLLLIGDHEQLRPLVEEEVLAREHGLDVSLMERLTRQGDFRYVQLTSQNRMRDEIVELNRDIYPSLRTNEVSVCDRKPPRALATPGGQGMFFVDTSHFECQRMKDGHGYHNQEEARLIVEHAKLFIAEGAPPSNISVLCMYGGQRAHVRKLLDDQRISDVRVQTIDQSQGDENDVVLVSLTRGGGRFVDTRNRRCVAVSRARSCLLLYGHFDELQRTSTWGPPLNALKARGLVGPDPPLECPRHCGVCLRPPGELCKRRCEATFSCGHICGQPCHRSCPPCSVPVSDSFPKCGHPVERPCGKPLDKMACKVEVSFTRPCGHDGRRKCHEPEGPCKEQVVIECGDCGREGRATCAVKTERPGDYQCPHPCRRSMRCGHPCTLPCWRPCDEGLDACEVCAEERKRADQECRVVIKQQIESLESDDYFRVAEASEAQRAEIEHHARSYYAGAGARARLLSARSVQNVALRRRFLLGSQGCHALQETTTFILAAPTEADAELWAREGLVAPAGGSLALARTGEAEARPGAEVGEARWLLVCRVQLGREYDCGLCGGRMATDWPPDGFDCTYDAAGCCHRIFAAARVLPLYIASVEIQPHSAGAALPLHWSKDVLPSQGWRLTPLAAKNAAFRALADCLRTDKNELGKGRDVVEAGKYSRLQLRYAWRIENPRLWRRYVTERSGVQDELRERRIKLPDPHIRREFKQALADLPEPLLAEVNEARLLHGTGPENVLTLLSNGPNERFSGGLFGCGTYLAEDAGKNDQYVTCDRSMGQAGLKDLHSRLYSKDRVHPGKVYYLLLCRTVLGRFVTTKDGGPEAVPVDRSGSRVFATSAKRELGYLAGFSPPVHYHALLAELGVTIHRFREFVQFRDSRIYPEYLLAYQRKP